MTMQNCIDSFPRFAGDWIEAWNARDLNRILAHYAEKVRFRSPVVAKLMGRADATLDGRAELERYFRKGLELRPNLHLELLAVTEGVEGSVIVYRGHGNRIVCERLKLDASGRIIESEAHYGPAVAVPWRGGMVRLFDTVSEWLERARARRQLAALDDRMLGDIGVSRCEAMAEAAKPFWEA